MKRHRHDTQEWGDEVVRRYYRRRNLPFRQLEAAWSDAIEQLVGPIVRWLSRRLS